MARSATLDMTQGSLGRQIIGFSLPLMFTNLLQMLFSMVDLAVVGRFSSSAAMGSVGSTTTLIFLFTGFLMGLGSGVNVLVATHFGARSEKNVRESVHTSFLVCLIAGFLMLALGLIFARPLLELLNTRDDLIDGAELYLRIYFLGMPAAARHPHHCLSKRHGGNGHLPQQRFQLWQLCHSGPRGWLPNLVCPHERFCRQAGRCGAAGPNNWLCGGYRVFFRLPLPL